MATLFLLCGLPGSGKTTTAKTLEVEHQALRLSPDEWIDRLGLDPRDVLRRDFIEQLQSDIAARVLAQGCSVILDTGFWSRAERDRARELARQAGALCRLMFLDAPLETLKRRVDQRNQDLPPHTFFVHPGEMDAWAAQFEPPTVDELRRATGDGLHLNDRPATSNTMDDAGLGLRSTLLDMGRAARVGAAALSRSSVQTRTDALLAMAVNIRLHADEILSANARDVDDARQSGTTDAFLDRLSLDRARIEQIARAVETIGALKDPVGVEDEQWSRPNGLQISRIRVPIGVIAMIYEARPNVTADAAALCVRAGNAVILRSGSECLHSARALHRALAKGLIVAGLPQACVQIVPTPDRAAVGLILEGLNGTIDLLIPRGGKALVARVQAEARAPVLSHQDGLNHTYVHAAADTQKARDIVLNGKMRRVSVCGATETLLIDVACAGRLLPLIAKDLTLAGCILRGDGRARALVPAMGVATEEDWRTEYLDSILAVRVVDGLDDAIAHIAEFGSHHTDAIVTEDLSAAETFARTVDSAIVLCNASTQFADGGEFGFGAEIGIATGRLHARGPVGAQQLTTYKYVVRGTGQTRP